MERAGDLLGRVARRLGHPHAALVWLCSAWPRIVGATLAAHTRPLRCENGRLEVAADAKTWQNQLDEMQADFCGRVNQAWGGMLIREVRFVVPRRGLAPVRSPSARGGEGASAKSQDAADSASPASGAARNSGAAQRLPYELDNDHIPFIRRRRP
jgi:predicted nucleic acid-binding Zn ribbon protein